MAEHGPNHELIERLKAASTEADDMPIIEVEALIAEAALALIRADKTMAQVRATLVEVLDLVTAEIEAEDAGRKGNG